MYIYQLKNAAKRSAAFAMAVGLLGTIGTSVFPGMSYADALNPLTERTLLLSSSSPGFHYLDGAGNTAYAAPGSGPNGKQSGETFSFKVSTNSTNTGFGATNKPIKAFTLQYCTTAAGLCTSPGDNEVAAGVDTVMDTADDVRSVDDLNSSDLNIVYPTPVEVSSRPAIQAGGGSLVNRNNSQGNFGVYVGGTIDTGWTMTVANKEDSAVWKQTGQNNFITLVKTAGPAPAAGTQVELIFYPTDTNYITNPGSGAFFVKINDYWADGTTPSDIDPTDPTAKILDGGVTVANVMTDSIQITTKVLETMAFSVGTENPDAVNPTIINGPGATHGPCDAIVKNEPINLGNPDGEYSLEVATAYEGTSYWRLSSNSSNGASVYYSGYTLSNTVGDQIDPVWLGADDDANTLNGVRNELSHPGKEQFGLAFNTQDTPESGGGRTPAPTNVLTPLIANEEYSAGVGGTINGTPTARFAFNPASASTPALLAAENTDVVGCTTGKMRYVGNIAAATPAGIYASKVNYLAAPQY